MSLISKLRTSKSKGKSFSICLSSAMLPSLRLLRGEREVRKKTHWRERERERDCETPRIP